MTDDRTKGAPMFTEIDHVAIAVNDLDAAIDWYAENFGATVAHRERVESDGVEEALLAVADSYIQLLCPTSEDSPVAKYLAKKGRASTTSATGSTTARPPRVGEVPRRAGHRRGAAARLARDHGRLRAPEDLLWHPDRAGAGVAGQLAPVPPRLASAAWNAPCPADSTISPPARRRPSTPAARRRSSATTPRAR